MKAEERHELKENDLSSWLQYGLPIWLKNNGSYLLLVLALAFLGFQLWRMYDIRQVNARTAAWFELNSIDTNGDGVPGQLQSIIDKYPDMPLLKAQGYLKLAEYYDSLVTDSQWKGADLSSRKEALDKASENYQKLLDQFGSDKVFGAKAILGMAAIEEDRDPPEFDKAKALYERLVDPKGQWANSEFADLATLRLARLDERKDAPRLISMVPPWPKNTPSPDVKLPGGLGGLNIPSGGPGLGGSGLGGSGLGGSSGGNPLGGTGTGLGGLGWPGGLGTMPGVGGAGTTQPGLSSPGGPLIGPTLPPTNWPATSAPAGH